MNTDCQLIKLVNIGKKYTEFPAFNVFTVPGHRLELAPDLRIRFSAGVPDLNEDNWTVTALIMTPTGAETIILGPDDTLDMGEWSPVLLWPQMFDLDPNTLSVRRLGLHLESKIPNARVVA
ncbi:MAG: hypothetical protein ACPGPD_13400 [Pseudomonadales bacterium]